jgi:GT2 family glycosyltransferase
VPGQRLTAAAGRAAGFDATDGEAVLFLDGDMELLPGWLPKALQVLTASPSVGAVTGYIVNVQPEPGKGTGGEPVELGHDGNAVDLPCRSLGGIGLYRRAALVKAGSFKPGLYSDEEPELCLRLVREGFRALRVQLPAVRHFVDSAPTIGSLFARRRRRLYLGSGQITRSLLGSQLLLPYLRARGYWLAPAAVLLVGLGCLIWLVAAHAWAAFTAWSALVAVAFVVDAVRKRSIYRTCYSVLHRLFIVEGMVRGFVLGGGRSDSEPRVEVVK